MSAEVIKEYHWQHTFKVETYHYFPYFNSAIDHHFSASSVFCQPAALISVWCCDLQSPQAEMQDVTCHIYFPVDWLSLSFLTVSASMTDIEVRCNGLQIPRQLFEALFCSHLLPYSLQDSSNRFFIINLVMTHSRPLGWYLLLWKFITLIFCSNFFSSNVPI